MPPEGEQTTTTAGTISAAVSTAAQASWYSSLDENTRGYIQNNGLSDKDPVAAFQAAAKSHQELFQHFGAPAERLVTLPADQNPDSWKPIWQKLGAPAEATGYDLSGVKQGDQALDAGFVTAVQQAALAANLPAQGAVKMTEAFVKYQADQAAATKAAQTDALEAQRTALKNNWGQNYEANLAQARTAFQRTGATADQLNALESVIGYDKVMEFFRGISTKIAEDGYVAPGAIAGEAPKTVEAAKQALDTLAADSEWMKRWAAGGRNEQAEMERLMRQANPEAYKAAEAA